MNWFSVNSIAENAYFVAGILQVFVIAVLIVQQIYAKKDRVRREDEIAINLCKEYLVDLHKEIDSSFTQWASNQNNSLQNTKECIHIINRMEVISLFFTKGIATSQIGKEMIGELYVDHIMKLQKYLEEKQSISKTEFEKSFRGCYELINLWKK